MQIYEYVITGRFLGKSSTQIAQFCTFVASFLIQRKCLLAGTPYK